MLLFLGKHMCKLVFEDEVSSLSIFSLVWNDEVHHQLLAK
jgi:hypothetical protein